MKNYLKEYFTFTKRERTGIIVLIVLIFVCTALPWFFSGPLPPDKKSIEEFNRLIAGWRLPVPDTGHTKPATGYNGYKNTYRTEQQGNSYSLFLFDPNTLAEAGWKKLGLPVKTIHTVLNYISHGGRFRKPEDLGKIYGLRKEIYERLFPYIHIPGPLPPATRTASIVYRPAVSKKERNAININNCDTTALIDLPGIGSRLAQRIINFRDKLGGFYSTEQVGEVYGLPDSTFRVIKQWLICPGTALKKININTADVNTLRQHPYIKWNLATAIVRFREQHGPYKSTEELQQIAIMTAEIFKKIVFYLSVE